MESFIKIERIPYEEPYHINLVVTASNGVSNGRLEIFDNADSLTKCASSLENFPKNFDDEFIWELGSEKPDDKFAFYFLFRVINLKVNGWISGVQIRFNNNQEIPNKEITEFCMRCEPAGLNRLGKLFREFAKLNSKALIWNGVDGEIINK